MNQFGYGGDLLATSEGSMLNYNMALMYEKRIYDFNDDVRSNGGFTETAPYNGIGDAGFGDGSGPIGWGSVQPQLQLQLFRYYGNRRILEDSYHLAENYVVLLLSNMEAVQHGLSDWMGIEPSPVALTGMGFLLGNIRSLAEIASILGHHDDVTKYTQLAEKIAQQTNQQFLDVHNGVYSESGKWNATQCAQSMALFMDLASDAGCQDKALQVLIDNIANHKQHLTVGMFGMKWMLLSLAATGHNDIAAEMMLQETYPGFGYMHSVGATTIWESWDYSDSTYSHNHPSMGH